MTECVYFGAGVALRRCLGGGIWAGEETANLSCMSAEGQEIFAQVSDCTRNCTSAALLLPSFSLQATALSESWEPTVSQLLFTVSSMEELTQGGRVEFGGDLQAVGRLIDQLLLLHYRLRGRSSLSARDEEALLQVRGNDRTWVSCMRLVAV